MKIVSQQHVKVTLEAKTDGSLPPPNSDNDELLTWLYRASEEVTSMDVEFGDWDQVEKASNRARSAVKKHAKPLDPLTFYRDSAYHYNYQPRHRALQPSDITDHGLGYDHP